MQIVLIFNFTHYVISVMYFLISGTTFIVSPAATRCNGDEERYHLTCRRTIPQDLHPEARKC